MTRSPTFARPDALETPREQILRAAIECVAEGGIDGATIRKVAERLGSSTGMITHHFRNKKELIDEAIAATSRLSVQKVDEAVGAEFGPQRLETVFELWLKNPGDELGPASFWLEYWAAAGRDEELRSRYLEESKRNREYLLRSVKAGIEEGYFRDGIDAELVVDTIAALNLGLRIKVALAGEIVSAERAMQATRLVIDSFRP